MSWIIWPTLQRRDFKKDDADKFEKYQAEALVHKHCPLDALLGMVCYTDSVKAEVDAMAKARGHNLQIVTQKKWYL